MDDRQLIADLLSALEYHTEQTRPIEFSKVAIEAAREYLRKPAQRTWVGLTDEERKLVRNSVGYNQFVTAGEYAEHVQKATEFKLLEKNT